MARITHDVGILIDQEGVLSLHTGLRVGVVGAVPLSAGGELSIGLGDVVDLQQLALAVDDVQCMLGKACGNRVAVRVSPGAEAAGAALFGDSGLDLGKDLGIVAGLSGQVPMVGEGRSASTKHPPYSSSCLSRGSVWASLVQK